MGVAGFQAMPADATMPGQAKTEWVKAGGNCIKIGLPGKLILGDYFQENVTS